MNPSYPGRSGPVSLWDTTCTKTITLGYDKGKDLVTVREASHQVTGSKFCLVTINNLSGVVQTARVSKIQNTDLKIFKLDNTDEIWWKTLPDMEAAQAKERVAFGPAGGAFSGGWKGKEDAAFSFDVKSGMGKGLYAINTSKQDLFF